MFETNYARQMTNAKVGDIVRSTGSKHRLKKGVVEKILANGYFACRFGEEVVTFSGSDLMPALKVYVSTTAGG